jgi:hypothetical protein
MIYNGTTIYCKAQKHKRIYLTTKGKTTTRNEINTKA